MRITVVIPLFNKKATIQRALHSVFIQTVHPEEIIVVNDGSTDGSEKVVETINHPLIKLIHQTNAGVSAARNFGIKEAKGDWIAFLDADDEWMPEYLQKINFLNRSFPDCSVAATAYMTQDHNGKQKKLILNKIDFICDDGILTNYFEVASHSHPPLWTSAVVVKKNALDSIGWFPVGIKSGEDLLTWARLASKFKIAYSKRPLSVFIQCSANTYNDIPSRVPELPDRVGEELISIAQKNKNIRGINNYVAHWFKMRSSIYLRLGMKRNTLTTVARSLRYNPFSIRVCIYLFLLILPSTQLNRILRKFGNE